MYEKVMEYLYKYRYGMALNLMFWSTVAVLYRNHTQVFWEMFPPLMSLFVFNIAGIYFHAANFFAERRNAFAGENVKMYCLCSKEALDKMKGIRGKMITQGGHAYVHAFWKALDKFPEHARAYRASERAYKITLVVPTEADLKTFEAAYRDVCGVSLVTDAGLTVFKEPTVTFLGIGPIPESLIGDDLKALKTLT